MKTMKRYCTTLCAILAIVACTNFEQDFVAKGGVSLDITEKTLSAAAQDVQITVTSGEIWQFSTMPEWVSVKSIGDYHPSTVSSTKYDWSVSLSASANNEYDRTGELTIKSASSTATITFTQAGKKGTRPSGNGTLSDPYNIPAAIALASSLGKDEASSEVFVKGKISAITFPYDVDHGTATFNLSEDGTTSGGQFLCYSLLYYGFRNWIEGDKQIEVGDDIIIFGKLTNYNGNKPESMSREACLYSLNGVVGVSGIPVSVKSVTISPESLTLQVGETAQLKVTVSPNNATNKRFHWYLSDTSVITLSSSGLVTAVGEGTATITISTDNGGYTATCNVSVQKNSSRGYDNGHEWVDLGLPSGTKWATCNVGTSSPTGNGYYYAWGETSTKTEFLWTNYRFRTSGDRDDNVRFSKYITDADYGTVDNKTQLDLSDDAARANWAGKWRIPTKAQWEELKSKCMWSWTGSGYTVTGPSGHSITLHAAGYQDGNSIENVDSRGYYWSSSLYIDHPNLVWCMFFDSEDYNLHFRGDSRYLGSSVRPVTE